MKTRKKISSPTVNTHIDFTSIWEKVSEDVATAFRMDAEERKWFKNKGLAKLIAAIPFLAGCEDAERTAVSHLGTYILSIRETKHYFNPGPADNTSIFERLRLGSNFKGGDQRIIKRGMSLIARMMLEDYKRDVHIDKAINKYNPIEAGAFRYEETKRELEENISAVDCPGMDQIFASDIGTRGFWGS